MWKLKQWMFENLNILKLAIDYFIKSCPGHPKTRKSIKNRKVDKSKKKIKNLIWPCLFKMNLCRWFLQRIQHWVCYLVSFFNRSIIYVHKRVRPLTHWLNTTLAILWKTGSRISAYRLVKRHWPPLRWGFAKIYPSPLFRGQTSKTRFRA